MTAQKVVLKVNPLSFFVSTVNVQGEYLLTDKWSVQLGAFFGATESGIGSNNQAEKISYTWFSISPEARYYAQNASKDAPRGLYMGPYLRYRLDQREFQSFIFNPDDQVLFNGIVNKTSHLFGGGVVLGYQWLFNDLFALDLYGGPQYLTGPSTYAFNCPDCDGDESSTEEPPGLNFTGVSIRMGASIGIAF